MSDKTARMFRIEYEFHPTRSIHSKWFEEIHEATDEQLIGAFESKHPNAKIRKIDRMIDTNDGSIYDCGNTWGRHGKETNYEH